MWIMGQNEKSLFNAERFSGIHIYKVTDGHYYISGIDKVTGAEIDLAQYDDEERAKEVLLDILSNITSVRYIFPPNKSQGEPS